MVDSRLNLPDSKINLTESEKEVFKLITEDFLTLKQIQLRRNCSKQAVYKILQKLKKKGVLNQGLQQVDFFQSTSQPTSKNRLHGQELNIKIISKSQKYMEILKKSNLIIKDGHTIRLYNNSIEIYSGEGISFLGSDETEATRKSLEYWKKFIVGLENEYKVILRKNRVQNIRIVNHHYAYTNSDFCKEAIEKKIIIKVFAIEDGKLAFITDDSFGLKEDECVHPETAKQDREKISNFINDLRINNPPTNSELSSSIIKTNENLDKLINIHLNYAQHLESHTKAIIKLEKGINKLVKLNKQELKKELKSSQTTLLKW